MTMENMMDPEYDDRDDDGVEPVFDPEAPLDYPDRDNI